MAVINVYNLQKEKTAQIELRDDIFLVPVEKARSSSGGWSASCFDEVRDSVHKGRSEVHRSGKKLWRQKGTGRARVGDAASRRGKGAVWPLAPNRAGMTRKSPRSWGSWPCAWP